MLQAGHFLAHMVPLCELDKGAPLGVCSPGLCTQLSEQSLACLRTPALYSPSAGHYSAYHSAEGPERARAPGDL